MFNNERSYNDSAANDDQNDTKESKQAGRWTKEEHQRFVEALKIYGKNWKKVEEHINSRSGAQIRSHAQKFFNRIQKEQNVDKGEAIENIANQDKISNAPSEEQELSIKKRSFNDFISNQNEEKVPKPSNPTQNFQKLVFTKDSIDVETKLCGLTKQIESSIKEINNLPDTEVKSQKLIVWKDIITAIIHLTKQFVDELSTQTEKDNTDRLAYYVKFLDELRIQLIRLHSHDKYAEYSKYYHYTGYENQETHHDEPVSRRRVLSEDHILLFPKYTPRLSDIVQINANIPNKPANLDLDPIDSTKPSRKLSFRIHEQTQDKLNKYEKFRKDAAHASMEDGRKRFQSFNQF